jgi:hypothetical protein
MGKTIRWTRAGIVASAVVALGASPAYGTNQDFTLHNHTERMIESLYVSPAGTDSWSDDILGQDILDDHTDLVIKFDRGASQCDWDIRADFKDGGSEQVSDVDFCSVSDVTFTH